MSATLSPPLERLDEVSPVKPPRRFRIDFWLAVGWMVIVGGAALLSNILPLRRRNQPDFQAGINVVNGDWWSTPSWEHPLGVDATGNDLFSFSLYAIRTSLIIGIGTVAIALVIGGSLGLASGYLRGKFDAVGVFVTNGILSFPPLLLMLIFFATVTARGPMTIWKFMPGVAVLFLPQIFRLARGSTMEHADREYVVAAQTLGAGRLRLLFREILPNAIGPTLGFAGLAVGIVIVVEGALSFLGAGISGDVVSLGEMIKKSSSLSELRSSPEPTVVPGLFLFFTVLSINLIVDGLRESDGKASAI